MQHVQILDLYKLQAVCTSCNLYKKSVQVATCTKSQLVHNIYIDEFGLGSIPDRVWFIGVPVPHTLVTKLTFHRLVSEMCLLVT